MFRIYANEDGESVDAAAPPSVDAGNGIAYYPVTMTALEILRAGGDFRGYGHRPERPKPSSHDLIAARLIADQAARILKDEFHATRVVLYGSLARQDTFDSGSDIDLAAWGIPDSAYFAALARLDTLGSAWEISMEQGEDSEPHLGEALRRDGIDL